MGSADQSIAPFTQPVKRGSNTSNALAGMIKQHGCGVGGLTCNDSNPPFEVVSEASQKWSRDRATLV